MTQESNVPKAGPSTSVALPDRTGLSQAGHGERIAAHGTTPLSVFGSAGDRLLGHRVPEACARRFVLDVADRLAEAILPA